MIKDEIDKVSYCFGITIAQNMKQQGMMTMNAKLLAQGLDDYMKSANLLIPESEVPMILQGYFKQLQEKQFEGNIAQGEEFLLENSKRKGVISLPSGLQYESLKEGNGPKPKATDYVTTHYHGTLIDGTVFDSSINRGEPATFPVNGVIKGWVESLQLMNVGSKWRIYVPEYLAYGASPHPGGPIEPFSTLIFDIELLSIN